MRYLAAIVICELAAVACLAFNIPAPMAGDRVFAFALSGHMAAGLACLGVAFADLARAIKGAR